MTSNQTCATCKHWTSPALYSKHLGSPGKKYCKLLTQSAIGTYVADVRGGGVGLLFITQPEFGCNRWDEIDASKSAITKYGFPDTRPRGPYCGPHPIPNGIE